MRCYDCAVGDRSEEAVGICAICGRAACLDHSVLQHIAQYRSTDGGMGRPVVRHPQDRLRLVCRECEATDHREGTELLSA